MLNKTKFIKQLQTFKNNDIELTIEALANSLNISEVDAKAEISILISDGFIIEDKHQIRLKPGEELITISQSFTITSKCNDYLKTNKSALFLKWYPLVISTIALLISLFVAIYK